MSTVERWRIRPIDYSLADMREHDEGEWVAFEDYEVEVENRNQKILRQRADLIDTKDKLRKKKAELRGMGKRIAELEAELQRVREVRGE